MIGHYLLTLTEEQGDRVLTMPMLAGGYDSAEGHGCLVGTALDHDTNVIYKWLLQTRSRLGDHPAYMRECVESRYDSLCARFGEVRVNAAIRNRILSNQVRRSLQCPQLEAV